MTSFDAGVIRSVVFIFGCLFGSFLGAAAYRIPRGMSMVGPRSHCPTCGHVLGPLDLVPVLSYILRRGRCGYCSESVSWRYPLIESIAGLVSLLLFGRYGLGWEFALYVIMAYWVLLLAAIDIEHHRLPNVLTWSGMAVGFLLNLGWYFAGGAAITTTPAANWQGVWFGAIVDPSIWAGWEFMAPTFSPLHSMLGVLVGGGILMLIATLWRGAMGWGDVKFLAAIGAFLGPGAALLVLFAGSLLGSIISVTLILTKKLDRRQPIPFGPFMSTAVLILAILG